MNPLLNCFAVSLCIFLSTDLSGEEEPPPHLELARKLIGELSPDRNSYFANPTNIIWPDEATQTKPVSNASVCSSFCAALLRKSYQLDGADLKDLFTEEWPEADEFFAAVSEREEFEPITTLTKAQPGDFLVIDYLSEKEIPTGHVMLISGKAELAEKHFPEELSLTFHEDAKARRFTVPEIYEWHVPVIDSSKGPHGKRDTRHEAATGGKHDDGLGEGPIRLLTNAEGRLLGYTWSTFSNSKLWLVEDRPMVIARWKQQ